MPQVLEVDVEKETFEFLWRKISSERYRSLLQLEGISISSARSSGCNSHASAEGILVKNSFEHVEYFGAFLRNGSQ